MEGVGVVEEVVFLLLMCCVLRFLFVVLLDDFAFIKEAKGVFFGGAKRDVRHFFFPDVRRLVCLLFNFLSEIEHFSFESELAWLLSLKIITTLVPKPCWMRDVHSKGLCGSNVVGLDTCLLVIG